MRAAQVGTVLFVASYSLLYCVANDLSFHYGWGTISALSGQGGASRWKFGLAQMKRDGKGFPEVYVRVGERTTLLSRITEQDLRRLSLPVHAHDDGITRSYSHGHSTFSFRHGRLIGWQDGPGWNEKGGFAYSASPSGPAHQFPMTPSEVIDAFGFPHYADPSLEIH